MRDVATGILVVDTRTTTASYSAALAAGKQYRWNVAAGNATGLSSYTSVLFFRTPAAVMMPGTPTNPSPGSTVSPGPVLSGTTVTLAWGAVSGATYYDVGVRDVATGVLVVDTRATGASYTATLTAGKQYRWNVAAGNTAGRSAYTTALCFQTPTPVTVPAAPVATTPGTATDTGATVPNLTPTLGWNAVSGATSYALFVSKEPYGSANIIYQRTNLTGTSHVLPAGHLVDGVKYRWNMTASNSAGESPVSNTLYFRTNPLALPTVALTAPNGGETWTAGSTQTIAWTGTGSVANMAYYKIALSTDGGATWPAAGTSNDLTPAGIYDPAARSFSWTIGAALNTTQARIRVRALAADGAILAHDVSGANFALKPAVVENLPAPVPSTPLHGSTGQSTTPTLGWSTVLNATSYRIMVATNAADLPTDAAADTGGASVLVNETPANNSLTLASPLNAGTTYYWKVKARNLTQLGTWSSTANFTTAQAATVPTVQTVAAAAIGTASALVKGTIASDGGAAITDRRFDWGTSSAVNQAVNAPAIEVSGNNFSATLTGLAPGTTYYFRAAARNVSTVDLGQGPGWNRGSVLSFTTLPAPPVPDTTRPTVSLTAPADGTTYTTVQTVVLTASALDDVGVTKVEFYDGATLVASTSAAPYRHNWPITRAQNGPHRWTARAYDAAGNHATSDVVTLTVNIPDTNPAPLTPTYVTAYDATGVAGQTITLRAMIEVDSILGFKDSIGGLPVEIWVGADRVGTATSISSGINVSLSYAIPANPARSFVSWYAKFTGSATHAPSQSAAKEITITSPPSSATLDVTVAGQVTAGQLLAIAARVRNTGSATRSFQVSAEIRKDGGLVQHLSSQTTTALGANLEDTIRFNYDTPTTLAAGTYSARAIVWSGAPGATGSNQLASEDANFSVVAPRSIPEPNFGLAAYNRPTNPFDQSTSTWYECTRYAWGRALEITGIQMQFTVLGGRNGGTWYWFINNLSRGSEPRANAIADWSGPNGGHVAFVEKVDGDSVTISEANWESPLAGRYKGTKVLTKQEMTNRSGYVLNGYVYVGGTPPPAKFVVGDRIQATANVNLRATPGGALIGSRASGGKGTIVGGMVGATHADNGAPPKYYQWWQIRWDTGAGSDNAAWSIESALEKISATIPSRLSYAGSYFGTLGTDGGTFAVQVRADNTGTFLGYARGANVPLLSRDLAVDQNGRFSFTTAAGIAAAATTDGASGRAASATPIVVDGVIGANGTLTGTVSGLNLTLRATPSAATGATQALVGFYQASTPNTAATTYGILGAAGQAYVLIVTPQSADGGTGTVDANGRVAVTTPGNTQIAATVQPQSATLIVNVTSPSVANPGTPATTFVGGSDRRVATERLINISSRAVTSATNAEAMIAGFVIAGDAPKQVLVRGVGPALGQFGVGNALVAAKLDLMRGQELIASNTGWSAASNASALAAISARLGAFPLSAGGRDAALLMTLPPGAYTTVLSGMGGAGGVSLIEVYDATEGAAATERAMINISTRARVGTGQDVLIAGLVISGEVPKRLLVRGVGPALAGFGVAGTLADPQLRILQGNTVVATNDNWGADPSASLTAQTATAVGAFPLSPGSRDAAVVLNLMPGAYTVQVSGASGGTGIALVEIYEVP